MAGQAKQAKVRSAKVHAQSAKVDFCTVQSRLSTCTTSRILTFVLSYCRHPKLHLGPKSKSAKLQPGRRRLTQPPPARRRPAGRPAPWRRGSRRSGPVAERPVAGLPAVAARLAVRRPAGRRRDIARLCDFFASDIFSCAVAGNCKTHYSDCAAYRALVGSRLSTTAKVDFCTFWVPLLHFRTLVVSPDLRYARSGVQTGLAQEIALIDATPLTQRRARTRVCRANTAPSRCPAAGG